MGAFACQVPRILDSFKPLVAAELMHDNVPAKYDTPIAYELSKILGSQQAWSTGALNKQTIQTSQPQATQQGYAAHLKHGGGSLQPCQLAQPKEETRDEQQELCYQKHNLQHQNTIEQSRCIAATQHCRT